MMHFPHIAGFYHNANLSAQAFADKVVVNGSRTASSEGIGAWSLSMARSERINTSKPSSTASTA
jgi:hypothetical protein